MTWRCRGRNRTGLGLSFIIALGVVAGCQTSNASHGRRVIVLGFDGLDYELTRDLIARGRLPNFAKLEQSGTFAPLETSIPPQSPVAWSSFITGLDPGGHGIFDFIHRDPATMVPYLSTTRTHAASMQVKVGRWQFPLVSGSVELLRRGRPFWEVLEQHGIQATIIRMPANFPPSGSATRELSGMGTPDLLGTYGIFSFYTSDPAALDKTVSGGNIYRVRRAEGVVSGTLYGPDNPFLTEPEKVSARFSVYIDAQNPVAKIVAGTEERVLRVGEWSDWVPIEFSPMPLRRLRGMCRFYLKQVRPEFELYVSPINLDPFEPALPISTPKSYAAELARATGRFYTQGIPQDTNSLSAAVLSRDEFLAQARMADDEARRQFKHVLDGFKDGLLFYYFGNVDQVSHMMWRSLDPGHPAYDPRIDAKYRNVVEELYAGLDGVVGETLEDMGDNSTLIVMSDHGFTSWRRAFHLNSWLRDNGYLAVLDPRLEEDPGAFANIDWSRTRAYALGLNGLYVNLRGRERAGIVPAADREPLLAEITTKLLETMDATTEHPAIAKVFARDAVYRGADPQIAPDLIIGYARGVRSSNESALGGVPPYVMTDNASAWSGDHCMDPAVVPGILLTNRRLRSPAASLQHLAGAILAEFGIVGFPSVQ
jgi:predicted AlkP superfamily phosphohydrolase/phosphomutase